MRRPNVCSRTEFTSVRTGRASTALLDRIQIDYYGTPTPVNNLATMKTGQQVYDAQCTACHAAGVAGAPKVGDESAWAPRIKTGFDALLGAALKGKGAMGAQGGGDYSDFEVARAVVFLANKGGAKFDEPKAPTVTAAASAPN